MLMRAATVVQVLCVLLQLLVIAGIIVSFKFYCKFYCMFYFTCDRSLSSIMGAQKKFCVAQYTEYSKQYLPCLLTSVYLCVYQI